MDYSIIECPVCHEGLLEIDYELVFEFGANKIDLNAPHLFCPCCGTVFAHESFQGGINFINEWETTYLGDDAKNEVENWGDKQDEDWECSGCHVKRKKVKSDPSFKFCPDCGEPVWRY